MRYLASVAFLCAALLGCGGEEGTIAITIVGDPNSDVLPRLQSVRATLSNPVESFEGTRNGDGSLSLSIDLLADGRSGDMVVEGFDAEGSRIAVGRVGPLPLAAIDAEISVYMAPPLSLAEAPVRLDAPRSHIGGTAASFGVLLAGGRETDGPTGKVDVYSTYLHTMQPGLDLPSPASDLTVVAGTSGFIYMLGGTDAAGNARSESYAFDTTAPPSGSYRQLVISEEHARAGAAAAVIGQELFVIAGNPGLLLDGFQSTARGLRNGDGLDGPAVTLVNGSSLQVIFAGNGVDGGAALYDLAQIQRLGTPPEMLRDEHRGVALPTNEALFVGGSIEGVAVRSAVLYSPGSTSFQTIDLLATPRNNPAVVVTDRYLLVIGGESDSGAPVGDVEVFDATTLDPVATLPMQIPRTATTAHSLRNGQVLIAGGVDADGDPTDVLELFTPDE